MGIISLGGGLTLFLGEASFDKVMMPLVAFAAGQGLENSSHHPRDDGKDYQGPGRRALGILPLLLASPLLLAPPILTLSGALTGAKPLRPGHTIRIEVEIPAIVALTQRKNRSENRGSHMPSKI